MSGAGRGTGPEPDPAGNLEGSVINVTNFGAFVDIGVHLDGLAPISALSDKFVEDPRDVVKAGGSERQRKRCPARPEFRLRQGQGP